MWQQQTVTQLLSLAACGCRGAGVCVWFKPDSHILVISQGYFTGSCDAGAAGTYASTGEGSKQGQSSGMRAAHHVDGINNT